MSEYGPADLAVVIPTRDRWPVLERALEALQRQSAPGFSVVVVVDGTDQPAPDLGPDVQLVTKDHAGPGAARNAGVRATDAALVLLLGDDMIAAPDLVERHLEAHRQHPEAQLGVLGHVEWHPEASRGRLQRWLEWSGTQFEFDRIVGEDAGPGRFYSSNVSVKRSFFLDVGGFDEDFPFVYEDIDLGLRLGDKGLRLLYRPEARTFHLHRYDWPSMRRRFRTIGCGEYVMTAKHPELPPYFLDRIRNRRRVAPGSPWPWLVDLVPSRPEALRRAAEERADAWYSKRLTSSFLAGWTAGAELMELRRYLGEQFDYPRLVGRQGPDTPRPPAGAGEPYVSTKRAMDGCYHGVVEQAAPLVAPAARVLHYGCGTGSTGLHLLREGHDVTFVDRPGPALDYLRWRLEQRGHEAVVVEVDRLDGSVPDAALPDHGRFDLALVLDPGDTADPTGVPLAVGDVAAVVVLRLPGNSAAAQGATRPVPPGARLLAASRDPEVGTLLVYATQPAGRGGPLTSAWVGHVAARLPAPRPWPPVARS